MKQVWLNSAQWLRRKQSDGQTPDAMGLGRWGMERGENRCTHRKKMLLSHTLTMRENHVASLVKFHPVFKKMKVRWTDR